MIQFYFDGNLVDPATNWQEVSSTIRRDSNLQLFLLFQEYTLTFADGAYDYIIDKVNNDSFCTEIAVEIRRDCGDEFRKIFSGLMFISDCEIDERSCQVKCKINDKSFFSKVNNNKNIKTSLEGAYTKNKEAITAIQQYDLSVYRVVNNTLKRTVPACRIEEAFRYMVDFMTDNTVGFVSDTFGATGEWNGLCVTTGERLRGITPSVTEGRWTPFSFLDLFNEVNKRIPLVMLIDDPFQNPKVRIESIEYLYGSQINFFASDIDQITTSFDTSKLYALVKFGSPTDDTLILDFPEKIDYFGYKEEEFHLLSTCNLDQSLDLSADWVVSSNIIQRVVEQAPPEEGFDSDLFLINSIYSSDISGRTTNDNFLAVVPARYHYNALLNNASISERYIDDFSASLASYYVNSREGQAYAYSSTSLNHTVLDTSEDFQNFLDSESYDYGNYYDTALTKYVALSAMNLTFTAQVTIAFTNVAIGQAALYARLIVEHYDSSNVLKTYYDIHPANSTFGGVNWWLVGYFNQTVSKSVTKNINMAQGDYLKMRIITYPYSIQGPGGPSAGDILYNVLNQAGQTFLSIDDTSITGGTFLNIDPNNIKVQLHKFSYPMTQSSFEQILANPIGRIAFAMNQQPFRYGWIKELKYNHTSGKADFVLTTSKDSSNVS